MLDLLFVLAYVLLLLGPKGWKALVYFILVAIVIRLLAQEAS